jgi:hypothetical protein
MLLSNTNYCYNYVIFLLQLTTATYWLLFFRTNLATQQAVHMNGRVVELSNK